jgi:hypothetical protein
MKDVKTKQENSKMKKLMGIFAALTLAFTLSGLTAFAATNPQQASGQNWSKQSWSKQKNEKGEHTLSGKLMSVDTNAKTFVVQDSQGKNITFRYNDNTKVIGSNQTVAGLASESGTHLKVTFEQTNEMGQQSNMNRQNRKSEANRLATKIEIQNQKEQRY